MHFDKFCECFLKIWAKAEILGTWTSLGSFHQKKYEHFKFHPAKSDPSLTGCCGWIFVPPITKAVSKNFFVQKLQNISWTAL